MLKYKPFLETISKALELKDDPANQTKVYQLLLAMNEKKMKSTIQTINNKFEVIPLEEDFEIAKKLFEKTEKKYQDKDKLQRLIVDKGNQLNKDKVTISKNGDEERKALIKEAEEYAKG